jgi:DNA-binding GntR family transcriptional regulator
MSLLTKEEVYEQLRRAIVEEELPPGQRLTEHWLSSRFGASRTPIREALHRLAADGLIVLRPRRGARVRRFSADELLRLYDLRVRIEGYAARLASRGIAQTQLEHLANILDQQRAALSQISGQRAAEIETLRYLIDLNQEFHRTIHVAAQDEQILTMLNRLRYMPLVYRTMFLQQPEERQISIQQHEHLLYSLRLRDPELAEAIMRSHVLHGRRCLLRHLSADQP